MRKRDKVLAFAVALLIPTLLFGTGQMGDILVLNGKTYSIQTNPLSAYLATHPGSIPKSDVISTGLWRGYVAAWGVKNGHLVLTDISILQSVKRPGDGGFETGMKSVMDKVFPGQKDVPAEWFTGHIIIPNGKMVNYVHMGYASTHEKYIVLRVEQGTITRTWKPDAAAFSSFRDAQFASYKKTEEYQKALAETLKEDEKEREKGTQPNIAQLEEFLREYYSERYMSMIFTESLARPK